MGSIRSYLRQYQYGNANYKDLWGSLEQVTGLPVSRWMSGYTTQKGYPAVVVEWDAAGAAGGTLQARQFPYSLLDGIQQTCGEDARGGGQEGDSKGDSNSTWWVPLSTVTGGGEGTWAELEGCAPQVVARDFDPASQWLKLNFHQNGYYRVLYPEELYESLTKHVGEGHLSGMDVAGLLDDARAFLKSGDVGSSTLLDLVDAVGAAPAPPDYQAWRLALSAVNGLKKLIAASNDLLCLAELEAWALEVVEKPLRRVGFNATAGDGHQTTLLRSMLVQEAAAYGSADARAFGEGLFWAHVREGAEIDPNFRRAAFQAGASANETGYQEVLWMFRNATDPALVRELTDALASVDKADLAKRTLELAVSDDVRAQDTVYLIVDVSRSTPAGLSLAWQMVQNHFEVIAAHGGGVGAAGAGMSPLIQRVASQFASGTEISQVRHLFRTYGEEYGLVERLMDQAVEAIESNRAWLDLNKDDLCTWVAAKAGGP